MPIIKIVPEKYPAIVALHKDGEKPSSIAQKYNVREEAIVRILRKCGAYQKRNSRQYFFREDFFAKIETEEQAYFLGLMYADGTNNHSGAAISLCEPDDYLLRRFAAALKYNGAITIFKKRKPFHKLKYALSVHGKKISNDLTRVGCFPRKSLTLKFPTTEQVPLSLMSHFLRGYFDGDGTLRHEPKGNKLQVQITSSPDFCTGFNNFLSSHLGFKGSKHTYSHSKAEDVRLSTRPGILFLDYIYNISSVKMTRKFDKFINFFRSYNPPNGKCGSLIPTEDVVKIRDKWLKTEDLK